MKFKKITLVALLTVAGIAQTTYSTPNSRHMVWVGSVAAGSTVIVAGTVQFMHASFSTGSSAAVITLTDRGSDCASATSCHFLNATPLAANSTLEYEANEATAPSGIAVTISGGTVDAHIHYATHPAP